jgi:hypothetical protein
LEGIGHSHLQDGNPGAGIAYLKQALASTRPSEPPAPGAFRKPSGNMRSNLHLHPVTNNKYFTSHPPAKQNRAGPPPPTGNTRRPAGT